MFKTVVPAYSQDIIVLEILEICKENQQRDDHFSKLFLQNFVIAVKCVTNHLLITNTIASFLMSSIHDYNMMLSLVA